MKRGSNSCSVWPSLAVFGTTSLQFLLGSCPIVSVAADDFFFREHDKGDSMFVLETGKVAVMKSWHGRDYLLGTLNEGDCFGEMAVMDHCPRSASVRAAEDCVAIEISAANLYSGLRAGSKAVALMQMNMVGKSAGDFATRIICYSAQSSEYRTRTSNTSC